MHLEGLMLVAGVFIILAAGAVGSIVLIVACLLREWKVVKRTIAITLATVAVLMVAFVAIMYFVWRPWDPTSEADLKAAYAADFGVAPPAGITVLKARQLVVGDAAVQWLLLKASPEEVEKHIAKGFVPARETLSDFDGRHNPNAPAWWKPPSGHLRLYESHHWEPTGGGTSSEAAMGVDASSGLIWFTASQF
ncbi:hypothetical protein CfE428DRAFT_2332 [Chthoniobacter flavus Ellin428]|uniref:Uncharacterized protein n=1 Tax=Chthoniobacter flavus Ellin428 TaxID=497964 RepID=B4D094_9BACT|nr:hypothetical protein [Chthoniobacter flavus]EDY20408.1 hypothetical protein CfE428DRAFT_2332 [Chthoniobacter flavus Ellin428]TCO94296.1 hypothetical protein EV701_103386 [Chthoniobacter flavus]